MKKFISAVLAAITCCLIVVFAACAPKGDKKPEKLKDGISVIIAEGESKNIDLSEYISIAGTEYAYTVNSSAPNIATVSVNGNNATITAVSKGSATVTASADKVSVSFAVTVNEKPQQPEEKPAPEFEDVNLEYDLKYEESKSVTLAPKTGASTFNYTYALKEQDDNVKITANNLTVTYVEATQKQLTVVATYTDSENASAGAKTVEFKLNITVTDTRVHPDPTAKYKVSNGSFDADLTGWTMNGEIGEISEQSTFWDQNFPIFNNGKYFSGNNKESAIGTLASSTFEVGGINKISFKLGAAGNSECYITLEKTDGTVLAIWRNTKFKDVDNWDMNEIGKTQFACNLVTYVADLSEYVGENVKIVLHDEATSGFGFFNFDELVTYYASEEDLPENTFEAVNQLADKTALKTVLDNALTAQGDYTEESFNAYAAKVTAAQAVYNKLSSTQAEVDEAKTEVENAFAALDLRVPEEKAGAEKSFSLLVGKSRQLTVSDYIDDKNLSRLTYSVEAADGSIAVSKITDGKFTVIAGADAAQTTVNIIVKYIDSAVLTVTLNVTVTSETAPVLKQTAVEQDIDLYSVENKTDITVDFTSNVENVGELDLTYTVTVNGTAVTLDENNCYTYTYGSYTETATEVVFAVKVSFSHNGDNKELDYNYALNIKDTSECRIANGGFDNGLDGWTLSNNKLGAITEDTHYWLNDAESQAGFAFGNDGKFFSAYAGGEESAMGTLISSAFKIGGCGFITYKLGAAKTADKVYLDIIEKDTGAILARYYNNLWQERTDGVKSGCTLIVYKADLSAHIGKTVYIRIVDSAVSDYGLFFIDSIVTYYPEEPASGFSTAVEVAARPATVYDIYNGGFENDLEGWTLSGGEIGIVTTDKGYWNGGNSEDATNAYGKEGNKLFSWWSWDNAANEGAGSEINREGNMGTLTSSMFVLKSGKYVSFKFGGGGNRNVFIELVNAENGSIIAVLRNDNIDGGKLKSYAYKVNELSKDALCYFRIVDNAVKDWGCFTADDFKVNLDSAPEGSATAVNHKSGYASVVNGSFESGNLDGWTMTGELGTVVNTEVAESWYQTNESTKDGNYLFTFHYHDGETCVNKESGTGIIRSSAFILGKNGIISFRFGAAQNREVNINVYTTGGKLLATFRNNAYTQNTVMVQYYYQFDNNEEISCYFEVVDNATNDYGCIVMDDFRVNLDTVPENAVLGSANTK